MSTFWESVVGIYPSINFLNSKIEAFAFGNNIYACFDGKHELTPSIQFLKSSKGGKILTVLKTEIASV